MAYRIADYPVHHAKALYLGVPIGAFIGFLFVHNYNGFRQAVGLERLVLSYGDFRVFLFESIFLFAALSALVVYLLDRHHAERQQIICDACKRAIQKWKCYHCDAVNEGLIFKKCTSCGVRPISYQCRCGHLSPITGTDHSARDTQWSAASIVATETSPIEVYKAELEHHFKRFTTKFQHNIAKQKELMLLKQRELANIKALRDKGEITQEQYEQLEDEINMFS